MENSRRIVQQHRRIVERHGRRFETEQAKGGKLFVYVNAGRLRLLIPDAHAYSKEIKTAEYVILSLGPWPQKSKAKA